MTMKTHLLLHLPQQMRWSGCPSWYQCNVFENYLGILLSLFHGTKSPYRSVVANAQLLYQLKFTSSFSTNWKKRMEEGLGIVFSKPPPAHLPALLGRGKSCFPAYTSSDPVIAAVLHHLRDRFLDVSSLFHNALQFMLNHILAHIDHFSFLFISAIRMNTHPFLFTKWHCDSSRTMPSSAIQGCNQLLDL